MSFDDHQNPAIKVRKVGVATVFFMIFCMSAAGAYGIEEMIPASGPGLTIVMLILLPFFWSIPLGLVASELGSAIPQEGGYYKWVQQALGEFWGFQAGWWRTVSIYIDSTAYIVLAVSYFSSLVDLSGWQAYLAKVLIVLVLTYLNIRGIRDVGLVASALSIIVMLAFLMISIIGFTHWNYNPFTPFIPPGQTLLQSISEGIIIGMWMYSGYESMSTMAGEIENPQVIPKATLISVPAIIAVYVFPTLAGLGSIGRWQDWATDGQGVSYGDVANLTGSYVLMVVFIIAAVSSNVSMYNSYLASGSRGFFTIADDNLAPKILKKVGKKHGTPYVAILSMAVFNLFFAIFSFEQLVVLDVFMLSFSYVLIYIAAIVFRIKMPDMKRPFKVPLGTKGLIVICIPPILIVFYALFTSGMSEMIGGLLGALSGPVAYVIFKKMYGGLKEKPGVSLTNQ
jgi:amino acid transporter